MTYIAVIAENSIPNRVSACFSIGMVKVFFKDNGFENESLLVNWQGNSWDEVATNGVTLHIETSDTDKLDVIYFLAERFKSTNVSKLHIYQDSGKAVDSFLDWLQGYDENEHEISLILWGDPEVRVDEIKVI